MALAATTIWEVETGASDTLNGGCFDPGQVAGMFADGAATSANTSAPVFSSASYNFVAGDAGAWLFIASGTNWIPGWYQIASVASNVATLNGTIGQAVVVPTGSTITNTTAGLIPSSVVGCATTASPTGATWSIDYSQQAAAEFAYLDLASVGAGLLVASAAFPFGKQQVGNSLVITGGTNFTAGRYVIASVSAGLVATVLGAANITTGAGANGTGGQGGALTSLGQAGVANVASNAIFIKTGTYTVTSASTNIAAGCYTSIGLVRIEGYSAVRGDLLSVSASGTRPTINASGISTFTLITNGTIGSFLGCLIGSGASLTSSKAFSSEAVMYWLHGTNCTNSAFGGNGSAWRCSATGCASVTVFSNAGAKVFCVAYTNTITGFGNGGPLAFCLSYGNTGASSDGFSINTTGVTVVNCVAYANGRRGFFMQATGNVLINCVAEANSEYGFNLASSGAVLLKAAAYNNTSGPITTLGARPTVQDFITLTASPFANAAAGDFSLNTTAGGGALLRAAGYPGVFPVGLTTGYLDVGAAQHADPTQGAHQNNF